MVKAPLSGLMDLFSKDSSSRTIFKGRGTTDGRMGVSFTVTGKTTRWMGEVFLRGLTEDATRANMSRTTSRDLAAFTGKTVENTKDNG